MMERLLYLLTRSLVALLQALPLPWVARLGRVGGALAYWVDGRHRRVAIRNLTMCFGAEKMPAEIRALARENFRRLGENYCCAVKTAVMTKEQLAPHFEVVGGEPVRAQVTATPPRSVVMVIGHFGNFELYARYGQFVPPIQGATTYRALPQPSLTRLMQRLREHSGCLYFERRTQGVELKAALARQPILLGLLADQHPGRHGVELPFLGHVTRHSAAAAVFALRYDCMLCSGICYRVGLARWRLETGPEIPTRENGRPRPVAAVTADTVRALEAGVRRDPVNWFWVHNRWKQAQAKAERRGQIAQLEGSE